MSDITQILDRVQRGDSKAAEELLPLVYVELRRLAAAKMANEAAGHTLQPTALVHEAWLRLGGSDAPSFQNRARFEASAPGVSGAMMTLARCNGDNADHLAQFFDCLPYGHR